jgi:hypothetical protein
MAECSGQRPVSAGVLVQQGGSLPQPVRNVLGATDRAGSNLPELQEIRFLVVAKDELKEKISDVSDVESFDQTSARLRHPETLNSSLFPTQASLPSPCLWVDSAEAASGTSSLQAAYRCGRRPPLPQPVFSLPLAFDFQTPDVPCSLLIPFTGWETSYRPAPSPASPSSCSRSARVQATSYSVPTSRPAL